MKQDKFIKKNKRCLKKEKSKTIKETLIRLADFFIDLELEKLRFNQN